MTRLMACGPGPPKMPGFRGVTGLQVSRMSVEGPTDSLTPTEGVALPAGELPVDPPVAVLDGLGDPRLNAIAVSIAPTARTAAAAPAHPARLRRCDGPA